MQDKFNQFTANVHAGKYNSAHRADEVEVEDASAFDQCMDLAFAWCDFLGVDRAAIRHQYANQVWAQPNDITRKYFDLFPNTPSFIPQVGDLVVFKIINGIPVGHISLVGNGSNINDLVSFDQNWDTLHYYHIVNGVHVPFSRTVVHAGYYGVAGFLRFKNQINYDMKVDQIRNIINSGDTAQSKIEKIKQIVL